MSLKGHVDRADTMRLAGWAISEDDPAAQPEVQIVQGGRPLITLRTAFRAPSLRTALGLPAYAGANLYLWRLELPLTCGLMPNEAFDVVFKESGAPLQKGANLRIELFDNIDAEAAYDLSSATLFLPSWTLQESDLSLFARVTCPRDCRPQFQVGKDVLGLIKEENRQGIWDSLNRDQFSTRLKISWQMLRDYAEFCLPVFARSGVQDPRIQFHDKLRTLYLPKTLLLDETLAAEVPEIANLRRVSGATTRDRYLVGGATTFLQLNALTEQYCGKSITDFPTVVDWGVGCGRVIRAFWEIGPRMGLISNDQKVIGLDIDALNVGWCKRHLKGFGDYDVLEIDGFDLPGESVNLLYGISVMTHLTELNQQLWLSEIKRVLRKDGLAILTMHGEYNLYESPHSIALPFVEKFGFFDSIPDPAIGAEKETYYRATYQSRSYTRDNWGTVLKLVDVVPAANSFSQDYVILQKG